MMKCEISRVKAVFAGLIFALSGSEMVAQTTSLTPWQARLLVTDAPAGVGGKLAKRRGQLMWVRGSGEASPSYRGSVTHVSAAAPVTLDSVILVGVNESAEGVIELVRLDPETGFRVLQTSATGAIQPVKGVFNPDDGNLYLTDYRREALVYAAWKPGSKLPEAQDWATAITSAKVSLLSRNHPFTVVEAAPQGGVVMWMPMARSARTWVHYNGSEWVSEKEPNATGATAEGPLDHTDPVSVQGPLEVVSPLGGGLYLESRQGGERRWLAKIGAGAATCWWSANKPLDLADSYRLLLLPDSREPITGRWFKPIRSAAKRISFGGVRFTGLQINPGNCYRGTSRFGIGSTVASDAGGEVAMVVWFAFGHDENSLPKTGKIEGGDIEVLLPEFACSQPVEIPASSKGVALGANLLLPTECGPTVFAQMAIVGPGAEDMAISEILGCAVDDRNPGYPQSSEQTRAVSEYWSKWGISPSRWTEQVLQRAEALVAAKTDSPSKRD